MKVRMKTPEGVGANPWAHYARLASLGELDKGYKGLQASLALFAADLSTAPRSAARCTRVGVVKVSLPLPLLPPSPQTGPTTGR
jgi:hypothetical protein